LHSQPDSPHQDSPPQERSGGIARQMAMATELPFVLVTCVAVGGLIGVGIDRLLHTKPYGMLLLGVVGFIAGVRDILRRLAPNPSRGGTGGSSRTGAKP
jgi:ATP synthase protein I